MYFIYTGAISTLRYDYIQTIVVAFGLQSFIIIQTKIVLCSLRYTTIVVVVVFVCALDRRVQSKTLLWSSIVSHFVYEPYDAFSISLLHK